jgi:hypothetical protein
MASFSQLFFVRLQIHWRDWPAVEFLQWTPAAVLPWLTAVNQFSRPTREQKAEGLLMKG